MSLSSPILIIGDPYAGKNNVLGIKKKFPQFKWITKSLDTDGLNSIRAEVGTFSFDDSEKAFILQELPDRKQVREFVIDLVSSKISTYFIVWDSENHIKIDPKTKSMGKDWKDFLDRFKDIHGSKIINNDAPFTEKDNNSVVNFIADRFAYYGKQIDFREARLLINIVGFDRGLLDSDIQKMSLICPEVVTSDFILDNAFPSSKEAVIYKLGNIIDTGNYEDSLNMMEKFLSSGVNENKIADVLIKKARWQLIIASLWKEGMHWDDIPSKIMEMGKFPSSIWHNEEMDIPHKKRESEILNTPEGMYRHVTVAMGIPKRYIKSRDEKKNKKLSETIPQYFMASQVVDFVRNIADVNPSVSNAEIKGKLMNRAIKVYQFLQNKLFDIREGQNPVQDLQEMIRVMTNRDLTAF